jgi:hypothetical protein
LCSDEHHHADGRAAVESRFVIAYGSTGLTAIAVARWVAVDLTLFESGARRLAARAQRRISPRMTPGANPTKFSLVKKPIAVSRAMPIASRVVKPRRNARARQ